MSVRRYALTLSLSIASLLCISGGSGSAEAVPEVDRQIQKPPVSVKVYVAESCGPVKIDVKWNGHGEKRVYCEVRDEGSGYPEREGTVESRAGRTVTYSVSRTTAESQFFCCAYPADSSPGVCSQVIDVCMQ